MKAIVQNTVPGPNPAYVLISHKDQSLRFTLGIYRKEKMSKVDVFGPINQYWDSLSETSQDHLFDLYKQVSRLFMGHISFQVLKIELSKITKEILEYHNFDNVEYWVKYNSDIVIPSSLEESFIHDIDSKATQEKTYTKPEYPGLITLAVALKSLIPVWTEYIVYIKRSVGDSLKEWYGYQLIDGTDIIRSPAFEKLKRYVESNIESQIMDDGGKDRMLGITMSWVSTEDFPDWVLAGILIKQLVICEIPTVDDDPKLIKYIYKAIVERVGPKAVTGPTIIRHKKLPSDDDLDYREINILDRYEIKASVSEGEMAEITHAIELFIQHPQLYGWSIDRDRIDSIYQELRVLHYHEVGQAQQIFLAWIMKPIISPRAWDYVDKINIIQCIVIVVSYLWEMNHQYLAAFMASYVSISNSDILLSGTDTRNQLSKENCAVLNKSFQFNVNITTKKGITIPTKPVIVDIDGMVDIMSSKAWTCPLSPRTFPNINSHLNGHDLPINPNIRNIIANLIIDLAKWRQSS